jgi:hypothetical protein
VAVARGAFEGLNEHRTADQALGLDEAENANRTARSRGECVLNGRLVSFTGAVFGPGRVESTAFYACAPERRALRLGARPLAPERFTRTSVTRAGKGGSSIAPPRAPLLPLQNGVPSHGHERVLAPKRHSWLAAGSFCRRTDPSTNNNTKTAAMPTRPRSEIEHVSCSSIVAR